MKNWQRYYAGKGYIRKKEGGRVELVIPYITMTGEKKKKYFSGKSEYICYNKAAKFAEQLALERQGVEPDSTIPEIIKKKMDLDLSLNYVGEQGYDRNMGTLGIIHRSFLNDIPIRDVTETQLSYFLAQIVDYSDSTISKLYQMLRNAYDTAYGRGVVKYNIMRMQHMRCPKSKKPKKKVRGLTEAEQIRFVEAVNNHKVPYGRNDFRLQVLISLYSGMRMGEVNALSKEDISFDEKIIHVKKTISRGKNNCDFLKEGTKTQAGVRDIPISKTLEPILYEAIDSAKQNPEGLLFYDYHQHRVIGTHLVNAFYRRICEKAGIEHQGCHALRHTFATRCIESGIPAIVLKKWLGHTDIHITLDTYADVFDRMTFDSIEKFDKHLELINTSTVKELELVYCA